MSYLYHSADPRRRSGAIIAVVAIHAIVGYVLVTGLAADYVRHAADRLKADFILDPPEPAPPPPDPVVQPEPAKSEPLVAPPQALDLPTTNRVEVTKFDPLVIADPVIIPLPTPLPLIQPKPTPSFAPKAARPRNDPARWVMTEDYPAGALRLEEEGTTGFAVIVGSDGRVDACEITRSSGSTRLDEATCRNVEKRARFEAATDQNGARVVGRYTSTVRWQIPR